MAGKTNLQELLCTLDPILHEEDYVFVSVSDTFKPDFTDILGTFKEKEGTTVILNRNKADSLKLHYDYIASWITLNVHSSLEAVGLTAVISQTLAKNKISCNVVAAYYHDHIFVAKEEANKAMKALKQLTTTKEKIV